MEIRDTDKWLANLRRKQEQRRKHWQKCAAAARARKAQRRDNDRMRLEEAAAKRVAGR